jgi:hypothetical protein
VGSRWPYTTVGFPILISCYLSSTHGRGTNRRENERVNAARLEPSRQADTKEPFTGPATAIQCDTSTTTENLGEVINHPSEGPTPGNRLCPFDAPLGRRERSHTRHDLTRG